MSDSNVGASKGKNIRNHIFVVNGIVHNAMHNKKSKPINITVLDYTQCFDSMWLEEAMNDLFNAGLNMIILLLFLKQIRITRLP